MITMVFLRRAALAGLASVFLGSAAEASTPVPEGRAFDPEAMDREADACKDFYRYACGGWHAKSPRPASKSFWSRPWTDFRDQIDAYLRGVVEASAKPGTTDRTPDQRLVGDFYAACMDVETIEARGTSPLRPELALIDSITERSDLPIVLGALIRNSAPGSYRTGLNNGMVLGVYGGAVDGWRLKHLGIGAGASQDPLNLPSREMYLDTSENGIRLLERYREHIVSMLELTGRAKDDAQRDADQVLSLETALAAALPTGEDSVGDQQRFINLVATKVLSERSPHFDWGTLLRAVGAPQVETLSIGWIPFIEAWDAAVRDRPLSAWQAYLRFHLITDRARFLSSAFGNASFEFFGRELDGQAQPPPRWQSCMSAVRRYLPDPLSRVLLERGERPQVAEQVRALFEDLRAVMRDRIDAAEWLSPEARRLSREKLDAMRLAVSHPQQWFDDPALVIRTDDFYGNAQRAALSLHRRSLLGIGEPVALDEWELPPIWVGGFYSQAQNAVFMTAAQLLFFSGDSSSDLAGLYGNLGSFIGHELSHGFDPAGSQFDVDGRVRPWWTAKDRQAFDERTQCLADAYSELSYPSGDRINGAAVVIEQTAELVGHQIALEAYRRATARAAEDSRDGLTAEQRFFVGAAQTICLDATPEVWRQLVDTDPHAFGPPGVTGTMQNMPSFAKAFDCQQGQALVKSPEAMCEVW